MNWKKIKGIKYCVCGQNLAMWKCHGFKRCTSCKNVIEIKLEKKKMEKMKMEAEKNG